MHWKRVPLSDADAQQVSAALQQVLVDLIALALQGKQAHWNVEGKDFLAVHLKLDEIIAVAREAGDTVAERIVQLGVSPDGRAKTVAETSRLEPYPEGFVPVGRTVSLVADRLFTVAKSLREGIDAVEADPLSADLLTGIGEKVEKELWMIQAIEKGFDGK